jgi:hypothetical protein
VGTDKKLLPDFQGGLVVADPNAISKLDGITGQPYPAYNIVNPIGFFTPPVLVHTDGTIFTVDGGTVVGIDPLTGLPKFNVQLENTIFSSNGNCGEFTPSEFSVPPSFGQPIIAGDGFVYFPYTYTRSPLASNMKVCHEDGSEIDPTHFDVHFRILRVGTDGSAIKVSLGDWSSDVVNECVLGPPFEGGAECSLGHWVTTSSGAVPDSTNQFGTLITNAGQGAFYSWDLGFNGAPAHQLTAITGSSSSTVSLPIPGSFQPTLQGSDGTLFGTVNLPTDPSGQPGSNFMIAMNTLGNPKWTVPNFSPQFVTSDGNVTAQSIDGMITTIMDSNGSATGQTSSPLIQSWTGNNYRLGSVEQIALLPIEFSASFAATNLGNPSQTRTNIFSITTIFRSTLAEQAKNNVGNSSRWAAGILHLNPSVTCNKFVADSIQDASDTTALNEPPPTRKFTNRFGITRTISFLAADWANPGMDGGCWKFVPSGPDAAEPGDILATGFPSGGPDATGHVGIVVVADAGAPNNRLASSADVAPYWWTDSQKASFVPGTITLTDYGFRLPSFDPANPSNNQGLKQDSRIRRFFCY